MQKPAFCGVNGQIVAGLLANLQLGKEVVLERLTAGIFSYMVDILNLQIQFGERRPNLGLSTLTHPLKDSK